MPYLVILLASTTHFLESVMLKKSNKKTPNGGFLFMGMISLFAMLFAIAMYVFTDAEKGDFTPEVIPYALIAGALYCASSFLTYIAVACGPFAITMLILSYSIVITCGYGIIFLNEPASILTIIGFIIIAVSLFLVRGKDDEKKEGEEKPKISFKWIICTALSVVLSALYGIVIREQQIRFNDTVSSECMIICLGFSALILFVVGIVRSKKESLTILKSCAPYAVAAGAANGATNLLSIVLNTMMAISISSPTRSVVKTAITFAYSFFILKEKFLPRQVVGIVLGVIATVLLNI